MTPIVAVVGSQRWPNLGRVRKWVQALAVAHPQAAVVSGGAPGVDRAAEDEALAQGLRVASLRPLPALPLDALPRPRYPVWGELAEDEWLPESIREQERAYHKSIQASKDRYAIHVLTFDRAGRQHERVLSQRYASFAAAAHARNTMIVQAAEQVVAFRHRGSPGTTHTISEAERLRRPTHVYQ